MSELRIEKKHVIITGYNGARLGDLDEFFNEIQSRDRKSCIQLFNAQMIAGWEHIFLAALNAFKAFKNNSNISRNISMEVLLFASGQHQIKKALNLLGVSQDSSNIAVLIITNTKNKGNEILSRISKLINRQPCNKVLELTDVKIQEVKRVFGISPMELKAASRGKEKMQNIIINLIAEHMAILSVNRKI